MFSNKRINNQVLKKAETVEYKLYHARIGL
jgi:hypothetical protein